MKDKSHKDNVAFGKFFAISGNKFITFIKKELCKDNHWEVFCADFEREILIRDSKIKSIKIPRYFYMYKDDNTILIIREKIEGLLLYDVLKDTPNNMDFCIEYIYKQLVELAREGYFHSDVRSWNILLTSEGPRLIDFSSISRVPKDVVWPFDLNLTLNALFNQIQKRKVYPNYEEIPVDMFIENSNSFSKTLLEAYQEGSVYSANCLERFSLSTVELLFIKDLDRIKRDLLRSIDKRDTELFKLKASIRDTEKLLESLEFLKNDYESQQTENYRLKEQLLRIQNSRGFRMYTSLKKVGRTFRVLRDFCKSSKTKRR